MLIRSAVPSDHAVIEALLPLAYAPVLAKLSGTDAMTFKNSITTAVSKYAEHGTWFVSEHDGRIVGCVAFFPPYAVRHPLFTGNCSHVQLLGVLPAFTNRGIGRALMEHCLAASRAAGAERLALQTSELMVAARKLYETLGFSVSKILAPVFGSPSYLYVRHEP